MFGLSKKKDSAHSNEETLTFLARGFEFNGTLNFDGTVRIDGVVTGEIHTEGTLIIGEHAVVEGNVSAGTVVSGGKINGNVTAREKVKLVSTAALVGTIRTPLLDVEEGVRLKGTCEAQGLRAEQPPDDKLKEVTQPNKPLLRQYGEL
ncbi:MAG TPA: polymer-forming cytoskeletal protein [Nitrospirales bacterium]